MFVNHLLARGETLPEKGPCLYEYVFGANGIFVRAKRPELEALIWVASTRERIRGLSDVTPVVTIRERVPARAVARMIEMAYLAEHFEILFYIAHTPDGWRMTSPNQDQRHTSVRPVDPFAGGTDTVIELHSHHSMQAFFSATDDREERAGFRVYSVIGDLVMRPTILTRVGIYGHFWNIPSEWIYSLPVGVSDGLFMEAADVND